MSRIQVLIQRRFVHRGGINGARIIYLITALSTFEQAVVFALGIFIGSLLWWLALTGIVAGSAAKLAPNALVWINRLSGLVLIGFAVYALSAVNLRALL